MQSVREAIEQQDAQVETLEKSNSLIDREVENLSAQMCAFKELLDTMARERTELHDLNKQLAERLAKAKEIYEQMFGLPFRQPQSDDS